MDDINNGDDDEMLPFGLSQELGQLILGAAQNFNADNPHMFMLGGDEDFGFNPGDEDLFLMDSDSDSYMEDDQVAQIFVSLADSYVIRRLSFHKNVDNVFRFPRLSLSESACYEEVYRLLEEVELLGKVWRKRLEHPYTAHIDRSDTPPSHTQGPNSGETLREGEDYNSSDYEYDSDDEEDFDKLPPGGVNENLTKKKYCQSIKVFHEIFQSVKQFDTFQRTISRMKKYIFGIIFNLFLEALPNDTRFRIPQELWEKVWKFTQNSYFRFKESVPLHKDLLYYKSGLRANQPNLVGLERERIRELFGTIGNLHMILFEVLFKNPCILQPSPMFELEIGIGDEDRFGRSVWKTNYQMMRTKFSRLQQLDTIIESNPVISAPDKSTDLDKMMESGTYLIHDVPLELNNVSDLVDKIDPSASVIVSHQICSKFALTGRYSLGPDNYGLLLLIVSGETGRVEQVIKTGLSYQAHLMEVGRFRVKRRNTVGWKSQFCITENRLSFVGKSIEHDNGHLWSYQLSTPSSTESPMITPPSKQSLGESSNSLDEDCCVSHNSSQIVCLSRSNEGSDLSVYSVDNGEMILSLAWPGERLWISGVTETRAVLYSSTNNVFHFFSLLSGEVIQSFKETDLNREFSLSEKEKWRCKIDTDTSYNPQFICYTNTLSAYKLFQFDPSVEMSPPTLVLSGSKFCEAVEGLGNNVLFSRGCLLTNRSREVSSNIFANEETGSVMVHDVVGYSVLSRTRNNLITMFTDEDLADTTLLNQTSQRWIDRTGVGRESLWQPEKRPLCVLSNTKIGVLLENSLALRLVDFSYNARQVGVKESTSDKLAIIEERAKKEEQKKKGAEEESRRLLEELESQKKAQEDLASEKDKKNKLAAENDLLNTGKSVFGTVIDWRGSYGFIRCKGKASCFGRIFFHLSDMVNRPPRKKSFSKGTRVELKLMPGREVDTYRGVDVRLVQRNDPRGGQDL